MLTRFDAYNPTFRGIEPEELVPALRADFGDLVSGEEAAGVRHGYQFGMQYRLGDLDLVRVLFGGNNGAGMHCESKGWLTGKWVEFVRRRWPDRHYLTRADICMDLDEAGAFSRCWDVALDVMRKYDLNERMDGDWVKCEKGRTYNLGSRDSVAFLRIYEKGKKDDQERPDWVRVELEIKPPSKWEPLRRSMASAEPQTLWGVTEWSADLYERLTGLSMRVLERPKPPKSGYDKRAEWLATQAYGALSDMVQRVGAAGLWEEIERVRSEVQQQRKRVA